MWRLAAIVLAGIASSAAAQVHLPQVPQVPQVPLQLPKAPPASDLTGAPNAVVRSAQDILDPGNLLDLRRLAIRDRLRQHRDVLESDPAGELIVRGEVVVLSPSAAALDAARAAGFTIASERPLGGGDRIAVLRAPAGIATAEALARLRSLDAKGQYDFNHIYLPAGGVDASPAGSPVPHAQNAQSQAQTGRLRIGLIDGGVDLRHPALRAADVRTSGCNAAQIPSVHGTAVASLLVGRTRGFGGAAQGATLYAADVYCNSPTGGTAVKIVDALAWMANEQVPVINLSLVGPANRMLEGVLRTLISRGHVIVAAVGNDGPASPPLYPAAYPDVIGVTAVDVRKQVLPEAVRGPQVVFSAPGSEMAVAASGEKGFSRARGTSFAAPLVAGLLAIAYDMTSGMQAGASRRAIDALIQEAVDLGPPGRDPTYGHGLVGERLRVDPVALR
jgi:subtilisin family serine protease